MKSLLYPDNWSAISYFIRDANQWVCQDCGRQCRRPGEFWLGWEYELTIAHWDQDYDSPEIFVVACCQRCHFKHDAPFVWSARRRHLRLRLQLAGQLEIFPRQ